MANSVMYRQVKMVRGGAVDTRWIPIDLAKVGKTVKIRADDGWQDGWVVTDIFSAKAFDDLQIERQAQKRWADVLTPVDD